jgi:hypothetical protein
MDEKASHPVGPESGAAGLRTLALRLLCVPDDPRAAAQGGQLLVGRLPDALPVDIPLPEGSTVVGSLQRGTQSADIVLDASLPAKRVLDFYKDRLAAAGWGVPESPELPEPDTDTPDPAGTCCATATFVLNPFGFNPAVPSYSAFFCLGPRGPGLTVTAYAVGAAAADVRLNLDANPDRLCWVGDDPGTFGGQKGPLPDLELPRAGRFVGGGSSGGVGTAESTMHIATELAVAALAAHYAAQLEQAGWTRRDAGQGGPLCWSSWTFQDEGGRNWQGTFFVLETRAALPRVCYAYLRADLAPA